MELEIEGTVHSGAVIDLREQRVDRSALVAAIRGEASKYAIECSAPGHVHRRAGLVTTETTLAVRTALAAAARSRGLTTPIDERIERIAADLAEATAASAADVAPLPEGPPPADVARLRERTAELRGTVQALEDSNGEAPAARNRLREAAKRLSKLETERIAADQTKARTRKLRDGRERRLRLQDRLANAEREARAALVDRVEEEYAAAVADIVPATDDPFVVEDSVAALAVLRVATVAAPVVLAVDRFESPAAAANWLEGPVIRL